MCKSESKLHNWIFIPSFYLQATLWNVEMEADLDFMTRQDFIIGNSVYSNKHHEHWNTSMNTVYIVLLKKSIMI